MADVYSLVSPVQYIWSSTPRCPRFNFIQESDLIHLNVAGTHLVIINSHQAAVELLDKRSTIYSDRVRPWLSLLSSSWHSGFSHVCPCLWNCEYVKFQHLCDTISLSQGRSRLDFYHFSLWKRMESPSETISSVLQPKRSGSIRAPGAQSFAWIAFPAFARTRWIFKSHSFVGFCLDYCLWFSDRSKCV